MRKTVGKWVYAAMLVICAFVLGYLFGQKAAPSPQITVINPETTESLQETSDGISQSLNQVAEPFLVDINTADEATLDLLPGIGPAYAQRIVEYRTQNGPFRTIEDIMNVSGIGEKKFEAMKDLITVEGKP